VDLSWSELLVVAVVALVIIGPKDLPGMFRELGRFMAKLRAMGREFNRAMEAAAKESGVQDVADDLRKVANPKSMGLDAVRSAADKFEKWDPLKNAAKPTKPLTPAPMPPSSPAVAAQTIAQTAADMTAGTAPVAAASVGPNTAALYEKQAARKAVVKDGAAKLRESATAEPPAAPQAKKPGRRRKKPEATGGDIA
jgi:sec-independent protein translocase protein TatB